MRFKKGSKVEVMNKVDVPISWRCAEIVSGNGHTYSVRYDCYTGLETEAFVERVPRKLIRPCPPPVEGVHSWAAGEVVEVFHDISWKVATVLKVFGVDYYLVRLLGISQELRVHKSSIRVRQSWQDDKWFLIGKGSGIFGNAESKKQFTSNCYQNRSLDLPQGRLNNNPQANYDRLAIHGKTGIQGPHIVPSRILKRASPYRSSLLRAYTGNARKIRAVEKKGSHQQVGPTRLLEKVDAVAYPRENMGEKYMHASFSNIHNGYYKMEREKLNGGVGYSPPRSSKANDCDSDICSVGSCSITSESPCKFSSRFEAVPCRHTDNICSEAESIYGSRDDEEGNCSFPPEDEVEVSVHKLELHAYRCTLGALYACGPLSWEQEALLTDLRIMLHISNDEHLMELRNLISF